MWLALPTVMRFLDVVMAGQVVLAGACGVTSSSEIHQRVATGAGIVFAAALHGQPAPDLYMIAAGGRAIERLTDTAAGELFPALSPDRTRVAFVRDGQLFVRDLTSASELRVAAQVGRDHVTSAAAWSPDGTRLVYPFPRERFIIDFGDGEIVDESYSTILHFVGADGTGDTALCEPPETGLPPGIGTMNEPAWSPDDTIAFTLHDDCPDCAGGGGHALIEPDGSNLRNIIPLDDAHQRLSQHDLDWSPDGTRWVYTIITTGFESAGTIATRSPASAADVVELTTGAWWPRWSPDGTEIAFLRSDGVHTMDADGAHRRRIVRATNVRGLDW